MIQRAHVIGMGRLGRHFAARLETVGVQVTRWNRTPAAGAHPLSDFAIGKADAVLFTVSDDALSEVVAALLPALPADTWLIHHAGSVPTSVLGDRPNRAVFWPPMTFQSDAPPNWSALPLAVECGDERLRQWARCLTPACFDVTEEQRRHLHLGAVLMGNLTAAWIGTVQEHLNTLGLDANILSPLAEASLNVALQSQALDTVTGPASRNDRDTLLAQRQLLQGADPDLLDLHDRLTRRILLHHGHDPLPPFQAAPESH